MSFFERHNKSQDKPADTNELFSKGIKFIGNKEYENAIEAWSKAIELEPDNVAFYIERGATYMLMEQFEKAIEDFNKVIGLNPDEAKAYTARGATHNQLGNTEKALLDFKKGSELGDKDADEYLKEIKGAKPMFLVSMNKNLWQDTNAFEGFINGTQLFHKLNSKGEKSPNAFVEVANMLDDIMQAYESKYGPIEDPIFFWYFATLNGLSLNANNDEIGCTRMRYLVNGYKEGLGKHLLYPSYTAFMIETALNNIEEFANNQDKEWLEVNRNKFVHIPG